MGTRAGVWVAMLCACSARPSEGGLESRDEAATPTGQESPSGPAFGPPGPPRELGAVDPGYPLLEPVNGACPSGSAPSERFRCTDVPFCFCEYVCAPACGAGEVCAPTGAPEGPAACGCHGALDASEGGCVWRGLVSDPSFDDAAAWRLYTQSVSENASADVVAGRLELRVTERCSYAWAGTVARLPPRAQLAEGAALVFDYRATGDALDGEAALSFRLEGLQGGDRVDLSGRSAQMRRCVSLKDDPWLSLLEFSIEAYGTCAEALGYELSVDDVRLEPDPSCG